MQKLNYTPILYLENGNILAYKNSKVYILEGNTFEILKLFRLNVGMKERLLERCKLLKRLLRLGIRNAIQIDEDSVLIFVNKTFYSLNLKLRKINVDYIPEVGKRALNLSKISGISGFDNMIVFGEYFSNNEMSPVRVFRRLGNNRWESIYTFQKKEINHIHNIVPDKENNCVWILTGDFNQGAAIWKAEKNFETVKRVLTGNEIARSCIAFPYKGDLIYATDTPFCNNSIRSLSLKNGKWESNLLYEMAGSCIYGCEFGDDMVFSTTVEPDGRTEGIKGLLSTKRGSGIKDNYSHLIIGNPQFGFIEVFKTKKDFLPYGLFQFGTIQFPSGTNISSKLLATCVATTRYDFKTIIIDKNNYDEFRKVQ